ncbi:MAG: DUF1801 domain-containing protein, partial [Gemmatimonadota bacterium]
TEVAKKAATKVAKNAAPKRGGAKADNTRNAEPSPHSRKVAKPRLLSGGNPQIAKGEGDAPVRAYIAALSGWQRKVARRLDALIERAVPDVHRTVKWNSPLYGIEGKGRFLGIHTFKNYLKVAFFRGTSLRPLPPGDSTSKETRYLAVREDDDLNEAQFVAWVEQASRLPGEKL